MNNIITYTRRRAVTLVEILIAAGLLSAVMIPVFVSFSAGNRGLSMSFEDITIHNAAIELLEQIMASPFDLVPAGIFQNDRIRDGQAFSSATPLKFHVSDVPGIERKLEIEEIRKDGRVRMKKVTVKIMLRSNDPKGQPRSFTLKSLLAREN